MTDAWHTFPAQMGEHRAFITFNQSYAEKARSDSNSILLKVRAKLRTPTAFGMPSNEEFPDLDELDDQLETALASNGGTYAGKITVNGYRHFFFYVDLPEAVASARIAKVSKSTAYQLSYVHELDPAKEGYWRDLYPTPDDWRVIKDLNVLNALRDRGDREEISREVAHWAYFRDAAMAKRFADWAAGNNYSVKAIQSNERNVQVHFAHLGTMVLEDITHHTVTIDRKARELQGEYDGWETSIEGGQM